jgi:hypothetical protein
MNIANIIEGFKNYGLSNFGQANSEVEALALARFKVCVKCPFRRNNNTCRKCNCFLPAKTRSVKEQCPIKNWPK